MKLFGKSFYDFVGKADSPESILNFKLKFLSDANRTRGHWIVVLCDKPLTRKVRTFFAQEGIIKQCQPEEDTQLPNFSVVVCGAPPRTLSSRYRVRAVDHLPPTMYTIGASVEVYGGDESKAASLGGFILVNMADGTKSLCGLTAGHLVSDFENGDINSVPYSACFTGELGSIAKVSRQYDWALIRIEVPIEVPVPAQILDNFFGGELDDAISQAAQVCGKATAAKGTLVSSSYAFLPFSQELVELLDFFPDHAGGLML